MPITLHERTVRAAEIAQIKMVLQENAFHVRTASLLLGLHYTKLSRMLNNTPALRSWWQKVKNEKKKRNARERKRRWLDKRALIGFS